jgi:hypothetical protein
MLTPISIKISIKSISSPVSGDVDVNFADELLFFFTYVDKPFSLVSVAASVYISA